MARFLGALVVLLAVVATAASDEATSPSHEKRLIKDLLEGRGYDARVRPVLSHTDAVQVKLGIGITDVTDSAGGVFSLQGWMKMIWKDAFLEWDPEKYGGIKTVPIFPIVGGQPHVLWTPDITLYKGQLQPQAWGNAKAVLTSNGTVIWIPQRTFKVQCHREGSDAPKTYKCKFIVGSWVHNKRQVELQDHGSSTIDNYLGPRSSWLLSESNFKIVEKSYPCCPGEIYTHMEINLTFTENRNETSV